MKRLLLFAGLFTLLSVMTIAQKQWVGFTTDSPQLPQLNLVEQSSSRLIIEISVPGMHVSTITQEGQTFQRLELIENQTTKDIGRPELPMLNELIGIPGNQMVHVNVIEKETMTLNDIKVYPFQTPTTDNPGGHDHDFVIDQKYYSTGNSYPETQVTMGKPGIWRDTKVAGLHLVPFEYNTANNELEVITSIKLEVVFSGNDPELTLNRSTHVPPKFYNMYKASILNFESLGYTKNFKGNDDIKYLIITNTEALSTIQPLVDWKNQQGLKVEVRIMETGFNTPQNFKDYISELYDTDNLEYILMVGDAYPNGGNNGGPNDVPMFWWAPGGEDPSYSDSWYSCMDGADDHFADISIGRFVYDEGELDELELQIQKTMDHYFYPDGETNWAENSVLIAHDEQYPAKYTQCCEEIRTFPYALQTPIFEQAYGGAGYSNTQLVNYVNANSCGIFNYRGHGSATELWQWCPQGSFTAQHVNQLTNEDQLFVFFDVCCDNMDIVAHAGDCLCESFMKSDVAAVAANSAIIPSYTIPNHDYDKEMYKAVFNEGIYNIGYVTNYANITVLNVHGTIGRSNVRTYLWLGDSSIEPWTLQPADLTVTHDPQMFLGLSQFSVNVLGTGGAIENAMVCVSNEDQTIYGIGYTDASGYVEIVFDETIQNPGVATVTVTSHNHLPYQGEIQVIPQSGPYVIKDSYELNDEIGGNDNGLMETSESILISLGVKNVGIAQATNVSVTLSTEDPYITFTDDNEIYGTIDPDEIVNIADGFEIDVANDIPDGHYVLIDVEASGDDEEIWTSSFSIEGHAPYLEIGSMTIDDSDGNNNGRLDPGETVDIFIETYNTGSFQADDAMASLSTSSGYLTLNSSSFDFNMIGAGLMELAEFNVTVAASAPVGTAVSFMYGVVSGGYTAQQNFASSIGLILEDWETGDMGSFEWTTGGNSSWAVSTENPYEGTYCAKSGTISHNQSSWIELDYEVFTDDVVSFYFKVSSEGSYDYLNFYIDNSEQGSWSGNVGWEYAEYPVAAGTHTFKWEYDKDGSVNSGSDCAWIDFIILPASPTTTAYAGMDASICEGDEFTCEGSASLYNSIEWETSGDGTFDDMAIMNPVYTPGAEDIEDGSVTLSLTAYGTDNTVTDEMILTINVAAMANAGDDDTMCSNEPYLLMDAMAENYVSVEWATSGDGTFDDDYIINPSYTPGTEDINTGSVTLTFMVNAGDPCPMVTDDIFMTVEQGAYVYAGEDTEACSNVGMELYEALAENYSSMEWATSGDGTFDDMAVMNPVYTPGDGDAALGEVTLTFAAMGMGSCGEVTAEMMVAVAAGPSAFAGEDNQIDYDQTYTVDDAMAENYSSVLWSTDGDGTFDDQNSMNPTYTPGTNDIENASVVLTMMAANEDCGEVYDDMTLDISGLGLYENMAGFEVEIFPNPNTGQFAVELNGNSNELINITIYNAIGEMVYKAENIKIDQSYSKTLNLDVEQGIYYLRMEGDELLFNKKIIIQE